MPAAAEMVGEEAFSPLKEGQRKEEQVELLRDRKVLDLESTLWNERKKRENDIADRSVHSYELAQMACITLLSLLSLSSIDWSTSRRSPGVL